MTDGGMLLRGGIGEQLSQPVRFVAWHCLELHTEGRRAGPPHDGIWNKDGRAVMRPELKLNR